MVKNNCLAKLINDGSWYDFRVWLEYLGKVFERKTIALTPNGTSQKCCNCGTIVKKV
jgi:putative transposase